MSERNMPHARVLTRLELRVDGHAQVIPNSTVARGYYRNNNQGSFTGLFTAWSKD